MGLQFTIITMLVLATPFSTTSRFFYRASADEAFKCIFVSSFVPAVTCKCVSSKVSHLKSSAFRYNHSYLVTNTITSYLQCYII